MRVALFGSDALSAAIFRRVASMLRDGPVSDLHVVCKEPKRSSLVSPLQREAAALGVPVSLVPNSMPTLSEWRPELCPMLRGKEFDVGLVVSFGYFMPPALLSSFVQGAINVHPSRLPQYRGSSPVQYAILDGLAETAVSVIELHPERFDAGRVLAQRALPVLPHDRFTTLLDRCGAVGADLVEACLSSWTAAVAGAVAQGEEGVSMAPKVTPEQGRLMWRQAPPRGDGSREWRKRGVFGRRLRADAIARRIRALEADTRVSAGLAPLGARERAATLQLLSAAPVPQEVVPTAVRRAAAGAAAAPGTLFASRRPAALYALCEEGTWLEVEEAQVVGKQKRVSGQALANGQRVGLGTHWLTPPVD